ARRVARHRTGPPWCEAVQRLSDDAGQRGLAAAARAAEQERMVNPAGRERVAQRARDMVLSDDLGERRRAILAGEDEIRHAARWDYTRCLRRYNASVSQICLAWISV